MATKKQTNNLKRLMDLTPFPVPSNYELENFYASSAGVSFPRRIIEVVNQIRYFESSTPESAFDKSVKEANIQTLTSYLEKYDLDSLCESVETWEQTEAEYWIDHLGKTAAVELIAEGKISKHTMEKMTKLPEEGYIKASQLCVQLANAIRTTTIKAEEAIGIMQEPTPLVAAAPTKKAKGLNLKNL